MIMLENKNNRAFTIIELIVVIAIIVILAGIVVVGVNKFLKNARDSRRIADLQNIQKAIEMYRADKGYYPDQNDYGEKSPNYQGPWGGGPDYSYFDQNSNGINFLDPLVQEGYLPASVIDPINDVYHTYWYWKFEDWGGCTGNWISIATFGMETGKGANMDNDCLASWDGYNYVYKITFPAN